jgi:hypothetical protein
LVKIEKQNKIGEQNMKKRSNTFLSIMLSGLITLVFLSLFSGIGYVSAGSTHVNKYGVHSYRGAAQYWYRIQFDYTWESTCHAVTGYSNVNPSQGATFPYGTEGTDEVFILVYTYGGSHYEVEGTAEFEAWSQPYYIWMLIKAYSCGTNIYSYSTSHGDTGGDW